MEFNPVPSGIHRQLKSMKDAGFRCVYLHPMPDSFRKQDFFQGMTLAYLGEKYFQLVHSMLEECRSLGLAMMLYDEGGWPSGSALGTLVRKHPECKAKFLVRGKSGYEIQTADYPDMLSARTTRNFIEMVHERYAAEFGDEFGKTIRGIFTDEPFWECHPGGKQIQISDELPALFRRMHRVKFEDVLPLLFDDATPGKAMETARRQYAETCARLFAKNYSGQISKWCSAHRLDFEGHFNAEDCFFSSGQHGDFMQALEPLHVPGVDTIWRQIYPGGGQGAFARFASSTAIRKHRKTALCECFNVYGYCLTTPVMSHVANTLLTRGINRLLPMPYLYSDRGQRKICCSTDISPRNPIWNAIPALNAFWNWAGNYDAGALQPEVWLWARPATYAPPFPKHPETEEFASKVETIVSRLDDAFVFWRFANVRDLRCCRLPRLIVTPGPLDEPELVAAEKAGVKIVDGFSKTCGFTGFSLLDAVPTPGIRVLPCQRKEGLALMIFNSTASNAMFKFHSAEKWRELMPPDPAPNELQPTTMQAGKVTVPLAAGELRILVKSGGGDELKAPAISSPMALDLTWRIRSVQRLRFSKDKPTVYETYKDTRELPSDGNYTTLEPNFSGVICLESSFELEKGGTGYLRFDSIRHGADLVVNGRSAGIRAFAPWVFKAVFRPGRNTLRLKISSSGGNEWRRCFREELEPAGWFNGYALRLKDYSVDDAECGISGKAHLSFLRLRHRS